MPSPIQSYASTEAQGAAPQPRFPGPRVGYALPQSLRRHDYTSHCGSHRGHLYPTALPQVPDQRTYRIPADDSLLLTHYRSRTIPEVLDRVVRYAPAQAQSMIDEGREFTAWGMIRALAAQVDKEFFAARAWRDGVPGILRAGILVALKFYVWAAFWQLSGGRRQARDDRLLRGLGAILEVAHAAARACVLTYGFLKRAVGRR